LYAPQPSILQRSDFEPRLVADRDAVAGVDADTVDLDRTRAGTR